MQHSDDIHSRLNKAVEYLRFKGLPTKHEDIAALLGYSREHVNKALKNTPRYLTTAFVRRFARGYSDYINEKWLIEGIGNMTPEQDRNTRPHITPELTTVAAGFKGQSVAQVLKGECQVRPVIAPFDWYDFTITVDGDSMYPELHHGDIIACQWQTDLNNISKKAIYVVDSTDGAVVKRLTVHPDHITCHSINPDYPDFDIDGAAILRVARVVGLIRVY